MARLRIDDILIEGDRVTIAGESMSRLGAECRETRSEPSSPADGLAQLPAPPVTWIAGGVAMLALGVILMVVVDNHLSVVGFPLGGGALTSFGAGAVILGVFKRRALLKRAAEVLLDRQRRIEAVVPFIREVLRSQSTENTVERIVEKSGATEAQVVEALHLMQSRSEVDEELDVRNGDWYYQLSTDRMQAAGGRSLDERLKKVTGDGP